ncbi:hypothetical protein ASPWEDRAFT_27106 [Aspergillus wentii DTO 134E9]|uniref:C2H2-type domain-containing protein n=1 Tax=Aspergillus wentii DTO 134E9 TaxID=1073089 RepID=A0A1L9RS56_ASPWE|nr:uncharacterized protein ASPWEDRAFT_27106 [Aspergillus wentii DTO 134E9]KAI9930588.1 hypothetical protein MW887_011342 [Aspergillus wentii]OJJ37749.1 hypothetical protein ASPWEDRAFT_27106 [Aspergillus wentii DTO 134E9]
MANEESEWVEKFLQTGVWDESYIRNPPAPDAPMFPDNSQAYSGQPPAARTHASNPPSRYSSPYPAPSTQGFVTPGDTVYHPPAPFLPAYLSRNFMVPAPPASAQPPPMIAQAALQQQAIPMRAPDNTNSSASTSQVNDAKRRRIDNGSSGGVPGPKQPQATFQPAPPPQVPPSQAPRPPAPPQQVPPPPANLANYSFAPRDPTSDRSFLKSRADLVKGLDETRAAVKITYDPKTIARDVLIAAGRHPTEKMLNHHLWRLRDVFNLDVNCDIETFRWDLVDPRELSANHQPKPPIAPPPRDRPQPIPMVAPPPPSSSSPTRPVQQPPRQLTSSSSITPSPHYSSPVPHLPHQIQKPSPRPIVKPPPHPTPSKSPQKPPQQPKKPQQTQQTEQPLQRVEVMVGKKQQTRGPRSSNVEVKIPAPVSYQVYPCEWENCQAELHNLDMLRQHLLKLHIPYHISCKWKECSYPEKMAAAELFQHMQEDHLGPIAWKLGDGPSVRGTGENALK